MAPEMTVASSGERRLTASMLQRESCSTRRLADDGRAMIEQALQRARFNKSKAAKELGLTRHQLYVRMRRYGVE